MAEELRFFLRIALYALAISVVYWFVSYEIAGTILLAFLVVGAAIFLSSAASAARAGEPRASRPPPGIAGAMRRGLGFDEPPGGHQAHPLEVVDDPIASSSIWPVAGSLAALLVALGLVYGGWFLLPGLAIGAAVAYGWLTQLV